MGIDWLFNPGSDLEERTAGSSPLSGTEPVAGNGLSGGTLRAESILLATLKPLCF